MTNDVTDATGGPLAWLRRTALRTRGALTDVRVLVLVLLANLVTILGASAVWLTLGGDPAAIGVTAAALLAFAAAMLPLVRRQDADGVPPLWPPFILAVIPLAVLIVGLPALGVWVFISSRPVNIAHQVTLAPDRPLKDGDTVVAIVRANEQWQRLTIVFAVAQHDSNDPTCEPGSKLTASLQADTGRKQTQTGPDGTKFTFDLGKGLTEVKLSLLLRAEPGCELDLSVTSAELDD